MKINSEYEEMLYLYAANERLIASKKGVSQKRKRLLQKNNNIIKENFDEAFGAGKFIEHYSDIQRNLVKRNLEFAFSLRDKRSSGEMAVAETLDTLEVKYFQEVSFSGLPFLIFDFYLPYNNTVIEVDGRQHFEFTPYFHESKVDFARQKRNDNLKRSFSYKNNIIYVRFKYEELDVIKDKLRAKGVIS